MFFVLKINSFLKFPVDSADSFISNAFVQFWKLKNKKKCSLRRFKFDFIDGSALLFAALLINK